MGGAIFGGGIFRDKVALIAKVRPVNRPKCVQGSERRCLRGGYFKTDRNKFEDVLLDGAVGRFVYVVHPVFFMGPPPRTKRPIGLDEIIKSGHSKKH